MPSAAAFDTDAALRALAHPRRRRMLQLVWSSECSAGVLAEECGLSKPAASQHLKVLRDASLVEVRARGNRRLYRARVDQLTRLRGDLDSFWGQRLEVLHDVLVTDAQQKVGKRSS